MNQAHGNQHGLYRENFEHDNCGIGAIVNIKGRKSHGTVAGALEIVEHLEHRAGKDAEGRTGDGVGIFLQISHRFFKKVCQPLGISLGDERDYGVGMFFFPQDELKRNQAKNIFEVIVKKEGLNFLGWREVPIHPEVLGKAAVDCMPYIMQAFIERPKKVEKGLPFDRRLYVVRRVFEQSSDDTYVVSLSSRTIVYKGMFLVGQLREFFGDLQDEDYESAIAMVHSRFSTNTAPSWQRAHPNRLMVHNGEINTIRGNADKMRAREETMEAGCLKGELHKVLPAINTSGSDSAMLDNALEACGGVKKTEDRFIRFHAEVKNGFLAVKCENRYDGSLKEDRHGRLQTTKPDAEAHGFGLSQMSAIAGKYHSLLDISHSEDHIFVVQTALKLPKEKEK